MQQAREGGHETKAMIPAREQALVAGDDRLRPGRATHMMIPCTAARDPRWSHGAGDGCSRVAPHANHRRFEKRAPASYSRLVLSSECSKEPIIIVL